MPPKKFKANTEHGYIGETKSKAKPKAYMESPFITKTRYDNALLALQDNPNDDSIKAYVLTLEMQLHGIRSAKPAIIVTEADDKAKRASRFKEDNDVAAWGRWFKKEYPGIPYTIDKVAQSRSIVGGNVHKASAYQSGNPDIFIQSPQAGFSGCYIEQKRDDSIFYTGTKILRPGSDNHNVWQSLYHADLREQGFWVMFSISLEATKKITQRYMAGNPYPQQVFEYYCKPEDYCIFEGRKHFKPIATKP